LAGTLLGAAVHAGINAAGGSAAAEAAAVVVPLPKESRAVRNARIVAGNGPLVGDAPGIPAGTTASQPERDAGTGLTGHAPGHGPLP
jgi:hypothetical protein